MFQVLSEGVVNLFKTEAQCFYRVTIDHEILVKLL